MKKNLVTFIVLSVIIVSSFTSQSYTGDSFLNENNLSKQIYLNYLPHEPISIVNDENFTDYGFQGTGTEEDPFIIENYNITTLDSISIYIHGTSKYFIIRNCYLQSECYGMLISSVVNETASIINNICNNNNNNGIYIHNSHDSRLENNTCNNNVDGITLEYTWNTTVKNNICNFNDRYGIQLAETQYINLFNNTFKGNQIGIRFATDEFGYLVEYHIPSHYCHISYNLLQENEEYGIFISKDDDSTPSMYNIIHHNRFLDNRIDGFSQAYDEGANNTWYETKTEEGNWWSNWKKSKPYPIDGEANSEDPYPLNANLKRINYGLIALIPSILLLVIVYIRKKR